MSNIRYEATFENGEVLKRTSGRLYSHAWIVTADADNRFTKAGEKLGKGFASSADLAQKAGRDIQRAWKSTTSTVHIAPVTII